MSSSATIAVNNDASGGVTIRPLQPVVVSIVYTNGSGVAQTVNAVQLNGAVHGGTQSATLPLALGQIEILNPPTVASGGTATFVTALTALAAPMVDSPNQAGYASPEPAVLLYDIGATIICSGETVLATTDEVTVQSFPSTNVQPTSPNQTQWRDNT